MQTVDDIIEALGGGRVVAVKYGLTDGAVSHWRRRDNRIPPGYAEAIRADLRKVGVKNVPAHLFGMIEARGRK